MNSVMLMTGKEGNLQQTIMSHGTQQRMHALKFQDREGTTLHKSKMFAKHNIIKMHGGHSHALVSLCLSNIH